MGVAAPASADPSVFGVLTCDNCGQTVKKGGAPATDQMNVGIRAALTDPQGIPPQQ